MFAVRTFGFWRGLRTVWGNQPHGKILRLPKHIHLPLAWPSGIKHACQPLAATLLHHCCPCRHRRGVYPIGLGRQLTMLCGGLELVARRPNDPAALQVGPCCPNAGSWNWVRLVAGSGSLKLAPATFPSFVGLRTVLQSTNQVPKHVHLLIL